MTVDGEPGRPRRPAPAGAEVTVAAVPRPQPVPLEPDQAAPRFLLDVHLGTLARRMRLLGLDTAYHNDMDDPALVVQANEERRVLLTQDRGLLRRRALWFGAYVRGSRPDDQLRDLLDRFAPALSPGPAAPPATANSSRSTSRRSNATCRTERAAATTSTAAAPTAVRSTGAGRTATTWRRSSGSPHGWSAVPPSPNGSERSWSQ